MEPTKQQVIERRKRWVEALRSGKYKQGRGRLKDAKNNKYCCLGVACEIFQQELGLTVNESNPVSVLFNNCWTYMPEEASSFLNITHAGKIDSSSGACLSWINDHGGSFEEIADMIESGKLIDLKPLKDEELKVSMKPSEVFDKLRWSQVSLMDDLQNPSKCCILGAVAISKGYNKLVKEDEEVYQQLRQDSDIKEMFVLLKEKYPQYTYYDKVGVQALYQFNDDSSTKFEDVINLLKEFETKQEKEKMATMTDVSGHADLYDDDIREVVDSFIGDRIEFTAFDVTKKLRKDGYWAEHSNVRPIVQQYCETLKLQVENKEVMSGIWARNYKPTNTPAKAATPTKVPLGGSVNVVPSGSVYPLRSTRRGGVSIPAELVKKIGCKPGDKVSLEFASNSLLILPAKLSIGSKSYTVDHGNRVVITKSGLALNALHNKSVAALYNGGYFLTLKENK